MVPVVTLIGRSGVGKSTIFNCLTHTCDALVGSVDDDSLGLTRDRRYGTVKWKQYQAIVTDTAGIKIVNYKMEVSILNQCRYAISESNLILFVVDGRIGLIPIDYELFDYLYKFNKSILVIVNKIDNIRLKYKEIEFYALGCKDIIPISAAHRYGIDILLEKIFLSLCCRRLLLDDSLFNKDTDLNFFFKNPSYFLKKNHSDIIVLAVVGVPNVGKSTFVNCVLGENRVIVCDVPGTTRDSICVSMIHNGYKYILVDTAGVRRKNRINFSIDKFSIEKTFQAIKQSSVVLLLIGADNGITNYDLSLLRNILRSGKPVVIGINKWDLLSYDLQKKFMIAYNKRVHFIRFVKTSYISALHGNGIYELLDTVLQIYQGFYKFVSASYLTRIMYVFVNKHSPPRVCGKYIKLKYAHVGGKSPFIIVIHGKHVVELSNSYRCYLVNCFSYALKIPSASIHIRFKESK